MFLSIGDVGARPRGHTTTHASKKGSVIEPSVQGMFGEMSS